MSVVRAVLFVFCHVALVTFVLFYHKIGNGPRGPMGLPVVGYYLYLSKLPHNDFHKLAPIYGSVLSVQIGSKDVVILDGFESVKDAFVQDAFMGRPPENVYNFSKDTINSGAITGLAWKETRNFTLRTIKDLDFKNSHLRGRMKEEIIDLLKRLELLSGHPSTVRPVLGPSVSNTIASLLFGRRLPADEIQKLDQTANDVSRGARRGAWRIFFPWLSKLRKEKTGEEVPAIMKDLKEYVKKEIQFHETTMGSSHIRDYIDGYLVAIQNRNDSVFSKSVLEDVIGRFFVTGSEKLRLTVEWLLLTMSAHPDIQKMVQAEIERVIGRSRLPMWDDHLLMPYTQASILELLRWRTIQPLNVLRYTLSDTMLKGLFIPKDAYVLANLWSIHHDADYWGKDVDQYRPERFLTENGSEVKKFERFLPFSMGKRSCPGEAFARKQIFLYLTSILQSFNVNLLPGLQPNLDGQLDTMSLSPEPQSFRFQRRF